MTDDSRAEPGVSAMDAEHRFVLSLYRSFLDRTPDPVEIAHYVDLLDTVSPIGLVLGIADSPEARKIADLRRGGGIDGSPPRSLKPLAIRADDAVRVIGEAIAAATGAPPMLDEVMARFDRFADGADLSSVLKDLTAPDRSETPDSIADVIKILYQRILHRTPGDHEVAHWLTAYRENGRLSHIVTAINASTEAARFDQATVNDTPAGILVQSAFEIILDRGASAWEVELFRSRIEQQGLDQSDFVVNLFSERMAKLLAPKPTVNNPYQALLFGSLGAVASTTAVSPTKKRLSAGAYRLLADDSVLRFNDADGCAVSIITSLFKGGRFIEAFLDNITSQTIFRNHCELIIVDAASPEGEADVIRRFQARYPNIVYKRCDQAIGIYKAWNIAIRLAKGRYLTNANVDDRRRCDSLVTQAAILDSLPFIDVTYQDIYYTFDPDISFDEIERNNIKTDLPLISRYNIMEFNSPHNAPMWRRSLLERVGYFNESYESAADFDFWLRCLRAGGAFFKSNEAHVAYYVNPEGVSTRPKTRGIDEAHAISREHYRHIISPLLIMAEGEFASAVGGDGSIPPPASCRYDALQIMLEELATTMRADGAAATQA